MTRTVSFEENRRESGSVSCFLLLFPGSQLPTPFHSMPFKLISLFSKKLGEMDILGLPQSAKIHVWFHPSDSLLTNLGVTRASVEPQRDNDIHHTDEKTETRIFFTFTFSRTTPVRMRFPPSRPGTPHTPHTRKHRSSLMRIDSLHLTAPEMRKCP